MRLAGLIAIIWFLLPACGIYSFTGASISPDIKSITIHTFTNDAIGSNPNLSQMFTEALREKFLRETNLDLVNNGGDLEFSGTITGYEITAIAPTAQQTTALNRLTITVNVNYTNHKNEKEGWTQKFSRYAEFESSLNLSTVEQQLIEEINQQLVEDIFNRALANW